MHFDQAIKSSDKTTQAQTKALQARENESAEPLNSNTASESA